MKRALIVLAGAAGLLLFLSGTAAAQPAPATGVPRALTAGEPAVAPGSTFGYYIWFDGARVHLRTTDPAGGDGSVYTGTIHTNGVIRDVSLVHDEAGDWAVAGRDELSFHFHTFNAVDGVSFDVRDADRVTFRLFRNGHLINTEHIFLGAGHANPPDNPFTVFF